VTRPYDEELDTHTLGTTRSPGVVIFSGHDRVKNWNIKQAKGKTGASTSLEGDKPLSFKARYYLAGDLVPPGQQDVFEQWDAFQRLIEAMTSCPIPFALPIFHPDLARNHITEVSNGGVGGRVHDGKGGCYHEVTYQEYKPAKKKASASPTAKAASSTAGGPKTKPDPNAAAKAELAAIVAECKKP
jgi:hypothetical protein